MEFRSIGCSLCSAAALIAGTDALYTSERSWWWRRRDQFAEPPQVLGDGPSLDSSYAQRSQVAEPQNVFRCAIGSRASCASAVIAQVESVQPEHAVDGVQFGGLDELGMCNGNREQRTFK